MHNMLKNYENSNLTSTNKMSKRLFGNRSRFESTWISGPTHEIRMQHIPGYTGHFQGAVDMGTIAKSYAKVSAHMLARTQRLREATNNEGP